LCTAALGSWHLPLLLLLVLLSPLLLVVLLLVVLLVVLLLLVLLLVVPLLLVPLLPFTASLGHNRALLTYWPWPPDFIAKHVCELHVVVAHIGLHSTTYSNSSRRRAASESGSGVANQQRSSRGSWDAVQLRVSLLNTQLLQQYCGTQLHMLACAQGHTSLVCCIVMLAVVLACSCERQALQSRCSCGVRIC
jgi:hypothetical protein